MQYRAYARQINFVTYPGTGRIFHDSLSPVPDNLWLLTKNHDIGQMQLHSLVWETPGTCQSHVRKISCIPDEVQDPQP
jgi:hypothetical protein